MNELKDANLDAGTQGAAPQPDLHAAGHRGEGETFDLEIDVKSIAATGGWLFVTIAVSMVLMWFLIVALRNWERKADPPASPAFAQAIQERVSFDPPGPRLQPSPASDLRPEAELTAFLHEQDEALGSYGWVSKEGGIARIPIARAIALLAEKGLPAPRPTAEVVTFPPVAEPHAAPAQGH